MPPTPAWEPEEEDLTIMEIRWLCSPLYSGPYHPPEGSPNTAHVKNVPGPNSWEGECKKYLVRVKLQE